jgi:uncharacterized damage-inducible protein DinB
MKEIILKDLLKAKDYTLKIANAMPEKQIDFKPVKQVWNFRDLILHLGYSLLWFNENYLLKNEVAWSAPDVHPTRDELADYLTNAFDKIELTIRESDVDERFTDGYYQMMDHNAHHRGQAVTYLRCADIAAPQYPF